MSYGPERCPADDTGYDGSMRCNASRSCRQWVQVFVDRDQKPGRFVLTVASFPIDRNLTISISKL